MINPSNIDKAFKDENGYVLSATSYVYQFPNFPHPNSIYKNTSDVESKLKEICQEFDKGKSMNLGTIRSDVIALNQLFEENNDFFQGINQSSVDPSFFDFDKGKIVTYLNPKFLDYIQTIGKFISNGKVKNKIDDENNKALKDFKIKQPDEFKKIKPVDLTGKETIVPVKELLRTGDLFRIGIRYKNSAGKAKSARLLTSRAAMTKLFGDTAADKLEGESYKVGATVKGNIDRIGMIRRASAY